MAKKKLIKKEREVKNLESVISFGFLLFALLILFGNKLKLFYYSFLFLILALFIIIISIIYLAKYKEGRIWITIYLVITIVSLIFFLAGGLSGFLNVYDGSSQTSAELVLGDVFSVAELNKMNNYCISFCQEYEISTNYKYSYDLASEEVFCSCFDYQENKIAGKIIPKREYINEVIKLK